MSLSKYLFILFGLGFATVQAKVVSIIASNSIPPYVMAGEPLAAELPGLQVEIVDAAFAKVGLKTNWKTMPNNRLMLQYKKDHIDAALNLPDVSKLKSYASDNIIFYRNCVIGSNKYRSDWREKATSFKILGFQSASHVFKDVFSPEIFKMENYNEVPSQKTIVYHAVNNRVELALSDALVFAYYAHTYFGPQYKKSDLTCLHEFKIARHLGFKDKVLRDKFNIGLEMIHKEGVINALIEKYNQRFSTLNQLESFYQYLYLPIALN